MPKTTTTKPVKREAELRAHVTELSERFAEQIVKLVVRMVNESLDDAIREFAGTAAGKRRQLSMFSRRCREQDCPEPSAGPMYSHYCRVHGQAYRDAHKKSEPAAEQ